MNGPVYITRGCGAKSKRGRVLRNCDFCERVDVSAHAVLALVGHFHVGLLLRERRLLFRVLSLMGRAGLKGGRVHSREGD